MELALVFAVLFFARLFVSLGGSLLRLVEKKNLLLRSPPLTTGTKHRLFKPADDFVQPRKLILVQGNPQLIFF